MALVKYPMTLSAESEALLKPSPGYKANNDLKKTLKNKRGERLDF